MRAMCDASKPASIPLGSANRWQLWRRLNQEVHARSPELNHFKQSILKAHDIELQQQEPVEMDFMSAPQW